MSLMPGPRTCSGRSPWRARCSTGPTGRPTTSSASAALLAARRGAGRRARGVPGGDRRRGRVPGGRDGSAGRLAAGQRPAVAGGDDRQHPVVVRPQRQHDARAGLAQGHARADRCGRRDHSLELPAVADPAQDRARSGHRVHRRAQARPDTPWNATRIARIVAEQTDLPPGVLNVVTSSDNLVGEELSLDHRVDMISFTGSTATGRRIMEKSAPTLKRLNLELGGKSAHVVLARRRLLVARGARRPPTCYHAGRRARTSPACSCRGVVTTRPSRPWRPASGW